MNYFIDYSMDVLWFTPLFFLFLYWFFCRHNHHPRRQRWRIAHSRQWLIRFRKNASQYTVAQRFSFLKKIECYLWEEILLSAFEERGYKVLRTKYSGDGGSDGYVVIDDRVLVIQAKRYTGNIAKKHILHLDDLVNSNKKIDGGLFIHTGRSSKPILSYIYYNKQIDMISGSQKLLGLLDGMPITIFGKPIKTFKT